VNKILQKRLFSRFFWFSSKGHK